jgi:outer membrane protein
MNITKTSILAVALFLGTAFVSKAQTQKFGYLNSMELLSIMPESKKADGELTTLAKGYEDQLKKMDSELQKKVADYQAREKTMGQAEKENIQSDLESLSKRMQSLEQSAQEKIAAKKEDLYKPILEKADKMIKETAKEKGYSYIFDTNSASILYAPEGDNIIGFIKTKLGIKDEPAAKPAPAAPKPATK